jgi:hypothetical protein
MLLLLVKDLEVDSQGRIRLLNAELADPFIFADEFE